MQGPQAPSVTGHPSTDSKASKAASFLRGMDNDSQFCRAYRIHQLVMPQQAEPRKHATWIPMKKLMEELGAGEDTVRRCIRMMRDLLDLPIHYVPEREGYGYTRKVTSFPLLMMTEDDLAAMVIGQQMLQLCAGAEDHAMVKRVLQKAFLHAGPEFAEAAAKLEKAISFYNVGFHAPAPVDPKLRDELTRCCANREEIVVEHCSAKPGAKPKSVRIYPLQVAFVNGAFYLYHENPAVQEDPRRKYALTRIRSFRKTGKLFKAKPFSREEVTESFGLFGNPKKAVEVELRFSAKVAGLITDRPWHPSQRVSPRPDGSIDFHLRVQPTLDLESFILPYAGDVEVIGPATVRKAIHDRAVALAEMNR